jgi:hypothetical protein
MAGETVDGKDVLSADLSVSSMVEKRVVWRDERWADGSGQRRVGSMADTTGKRMAGYWVADSAAVLAVWRGKIPVDLKGAMLVV